ncbi:hypothetical protein [Actinoplanes regularis]|uniref:hypothetical protein n=1 Tax=Actinoplanes regularis TaxID=52697 RepID=UPI0024A45199|nr:hypothetical protein [Actinoplanes regularis]GLW32660.1 hypothetical protein Areg01_55980 [Actinoplanes regularis]
MEITGVMATDAGMGALWALGSFGGIVDYDTWESELLEDEDIARHIAGGALVPVNIGGDGAFQVVARVGESSALAQLTERERKYVVVASEPYLLITTNDAVISGIEHVAAESNDNLRVPLPAGRWSVAIFLIDWEAEPGQADDAGRPAPTALSDFTILINPEGQPNREYRTQIQTFER